MQDAIRELQMSLFYKLWAAHGNHVNSVPVFEDEEQAVTYLNDLIGDHCGGFPVPALEGCVGNLVQADRILASIAIADATKASPSTLVNARKQLAACDANSTAGRCSGGRKLSASLVDRHQLVARLSRFVTAWSTRMIRIRALPGTDR